MPNYRELTRQLMPWLPAGLANVYADAWTESGDPALALAEMRSAPTYENFFAGNRRNDGSIILEEQEYLATTEAYGLRFSQFGLGADFMTEDFPEFIRLGLSPNELEERLGSIYVNVVTQGQNVREYYATNFGTQDLSDAAIFASALKPDTSPLVFERRFRTSQIGGEAARLGFDLELEEAERLFSFGLDQETSRRFFSVAAQQLPTLQEVQRRFDDPDDALQLTDLADALIIQEPDQMRRLNRLFSQERSLFSSAQSRVDEFGRIRGLRRFG